MTDKMLSAEKVSALLDKLNRLNYDGATINRIESELELGQLDADCPKCLRCRDTGVKTIHGDLGGPSFKAACDCPAAKQEEVNSDH